MSTILGLWHRDGEPVEQGLLKAMLSASQPMLIDREDIWQDADVGLACRHFWITPEEVNQPQPRLDPETGCALVCSARLDNRPELLASLGLSGIEAKNLSDADLILSAYRRWGTDCPLHLLGDFAFILWDPRQRQVFAARDALGAEELYYYLDRKYWIAASRVSAILAHPAILAELNEVKIAEYLALQWGDDVNTFYKSIFHLPPAHSMLVTSETSRLWHYWEIDPHNQIRYPRPEAYAEHYRELIITALRCRLRSAYPVGVSLSGGLDSSTLACLASQLFPQVDLPQDHMWSLSFVFDELKSCDERAYIQPVLEQTARWSGLQPVFIPSDDLYPLPIDPSSPVNSDYPYQDLYFYLLRAILGTAHTNGLRLMISGYYGDDLYSGDAFWFADLLREGRLLQATKIGMTSHRQINFKRDLIDYGLRALSPSWLKTAYRRLRPRHLDWESWVHPRLAAQNGLVQLEKDTQSGQKGLLPGQRARYSALFQSGYSESVTVLQDIANRAGMKYSFPFLDRRLVEFVLALPAEQVGLPGNSRRVLRDATSGILPESVRRRQDKTSLLELCNLGIYERSINEIRKFLDRSQAVERGFIRGDWLASELSHPIGFTREGLILWLVVCLESWLQKYW